MHLFTVIGGLLAVIGRSYLHSKVRARPGRGQPPTDG